MKRTFALILMTCLATSAWASPPHRQSRLKGALPPELRLSPVTAPPHGPAVALDDIAVDGHIDRPSVVYVIDRARVRWDELQQVKDFVPGILANANARPF